MENGGKIARVNAYFLSEPAQPFFSSHGLDLRDDGMRVLRRGGFGNSLQRSTHSTDDGSALGDPVLRL